MKNVYNKRQNSSTDWAYIFVAHNPMENYKKNSQKNCRHSSFLKIHQFYQENSRTFVCIAECDENGDLESKS